MRLNLARALMCRSDLLLLDEPTNHLDLDSIAAVEAALSAYDGALLVVSHDEAFLDGIVISRRISLAGAGIREATSPRPAEKMRRSGK